MPICVLNEAKSSLIEQRTANEPGKILQRELTASATLRLFENFHLNDLCLAAGKGLLVQSWPWQESCNKVSNQLVWLVNVVETY